MGPNRSEPMTRRKFTRRSAQTLTLSALCGASTCTALADPPISRLFTFTEGSNQVRIQCYLHTSQYKPQGWYEKAERIIELGRPFRV